MGFKIEKGAEDFETLVGYYLKEYKKMQTVGDDLVKGMSSFDALGATLIRNRNNLIKVLDGEMYNYETIVYSRLRGIKPRHKELSQLYRRTAEKIFLAIRDIQLENLTTNIYEIYIYESQEEIKKEQKQRKL